MYAIYANIGDILMGSMLPYIAYMDPMGFKKPEPFDFNGIPPNPPFFCSWTVLFFKWSTRDLAATLWHGTYPAWLCQNSC